MRDVKMTAAWPSDAEGIRLADDYPARLRNSPVCGP